MVGGSHPPKLIFQKNVQILVHVVVDRMSPTEPQSLSQMISEIWQTVEGGNCRFIDTHKIFRLTFPKLYNLQNGTK